jgi:hypothetical protein
MRVGEQMRGADATQNRKNRPVSQSRCGLI